jgi:hypothetical protein
MFFQIVGKITKVTLIARGVGLRAGAKLRRKYGGANWRKLKGIARVRLTGGNERIAEVHWYEAHGIGKKDRKIKRFLN